MLKLVCPDESTLINRLEGRALCIRVSDTREISAAAERAGLRNRLFCVICDCATPLDAIDPEDDWRAIPLAIVAPSIGRFRNLSMKLARLRKLNLRVQLPCDKENLTGARILASVGIAVCVDIDAEMHPDWDALADLMTYALLGIAPHASINPFQAIADGYRQAARSEDWGRVTFDDPSRYLHLDAAGRIALSRRELLAGEFIADDPAKIDSSEVANAIERRTEMWRDQFVEHHFCSTCKAWRVCRARAARGKTEPDGCEGFFHEMADVIERHRRKSRSNRPAETWQP